MLPFILYLLAYLPVLKVQLRRKLETVTGGEFDWGGRL